MSDLKIKQHLSGVLALILVTILWGSTFVVVKETVKTIPASVLILSRFGLSALVFLPCLRPNWRLCWAGLELGLWLFAGYATQTIGLQYTTVNRSAFITTLYVIFLPLLLGLLGRRIGRSTAIAAGCAFAGVGLLAYEGAAPNLGDLWTVATALSWMMYIWRMETYATFSPSLSLTGAQLLGTARFSLLWVQVSHPNWSFAPEFPWLSVLYLALITTALSTWLQTWGQAQVRALEAAVIYTLEPVWASLFAYWTINEKLGTQGIIGAGLIIGAILITQFPRFQAG